MSNKDNKYRPDSVQDDLLERAKKLQTETQKNTSSNNLGDNLWEKLTKKFKKKHNSKLQIIGFIFTLFQKLWRTFQWTAYQHENGELVLDDDNSAIFSSKRLAIITLFAAGILFAVHMTVSAIYYYSTQFSETVYVTGKQEITTGELYQFGGCTSLPCSTEIDNGKFYLIESSFYFPRMYYPEQNVYANIPQQNAACEIKGYGIYFRNLRWLYKSAQLYQHVTNVSCRPYTKDELEKAVSNGAILKKI